MKDLIVKHKGKDVKLTYKLALPTIVGVEREIKTKSRPGIAVLATIEKISNTVDTSPTLRKYGINDNIKKALQKVEKT